MQVWDRQEERAELWPERRVQAGIQPVKHGSALVHEETAPVGFFILFFGGLKFGERTKLFIIYLIIKRRLSSPIIFHQAV